MAKKKVEEMTAEQVATGTLENEVAEGANEKATAVEYNYPDIIREELIKTGRDGVLDLIEYMRECGFFEAPASGGNHSHEKGAPAAAEAFPATPAAPGKALDPAAVRTAREPPSGKQNGAPGDACRNTR